MLGDIKNVVIVLTPPFSGTKWRKTKFFRLCDDDHGDTIEKRHSAGHGTPVLKVRMTSTWIKEICSPIKVSFGDVIEMVEDYRACCYVVKYHFI
jgi:hypothetical protein